MTKYYSKTTNGFYSVPDIFSQANLPSDAVEITDAQWTALLTEQSSGMIIQSDSNGNPIAVSALPAATPVPDLATQLAAALITNGTIQASALQASTLAMVNTNLTAAGMATIATTTTTTAQG